MVVSCCVVDCTIKFLPHHPKETRRSQKALERSNKTREFRWGGGGGGGGGGGVKYWKTADHDRA